MSDNLRSYIKNNKEKFETEEPSKDLWNKIDARMEVKNSSWISSKLLSKLKYLGLSATVLVIGTYFVTRNLDNSTSNELAQNTKDSAMNNSGEWVRANVKPEIDHAKNSDTEENKKTAENIQAPEEERSGIDKIIVKKDSVVSKPAEASIEINKTGANTAPKEETANVTVAEKKETSGPARKSEAAAEEKVNTYRCTLLEGASFCSVVKGFKFPGQVSVDGKIETTACSKLEDISNLKAVVVKGRTSKEIELSFNEGFKNIVIQKSDGTKITPVAISHYYKGLGVISAYKGKRFDMMFKDKVEMILFFKNVEEGDKIVIDKTIEAVVSKP